MPTQPKLPRGDERRDAALDLALREVVPGQGAMERADQPDGFITAIRRVPASDARYEDFPPGIDPRLRAALSRRGIDRLYTHQARAIAHALAGRHVVVTTPTASGKTLCYNVPVMNGILADPATRALYLFPTKALAQDQLAELDRLSQEISRAAEVDVGVFTYDGDTPQDARRAIRGRAHVVLTNPDMLHSGVLPHHPKWAKLFENLRYIVIDELHAYRGVFGSHLGNVLRRLRRVCEHYGSSPTFICSSATIANPVELAEGLAERPFELVEESGAPRGEKWLVFVNPPIVNRQLGIRRSYISQARAVALEFLNKGLQVIVFAQSRLSTEILTRYLKDAHEGAPGESDVIRGYRGGYLPHRRREIEKGLRDGTVRGVVSTNALELGIDIGALDVAVLAGYPGTIASTWQRFGRAGRRASRSAAVMVASSAPLDQFVVRHPSYFFDASPEHALVNPDNLQILVDHIKCAAFELPFTTTETYGRENLQEILGILSEEGFVHLSKPGAAEDATGHWHWTNESYPADAVSLRTVSSDNFVVVDKTDTTRVIGETDFNTALEILHEKAIYIVEGRLYQVERARLRGPQGVRPPHRLRLLHRRHHEQPRHAARDGRHGGRATRGAPGARRRARRVARGGVQEDQVLYERERRVGRTRPSRAPDAHDVVLADDPAGARDRPAVQRRRPTGRCRGDVARHAPGRAVAADVRRPRHRRLHRPRAGGHRGRAGARRRGTRRVVDAGPPGRRRAPGVHLRQLPRRHRLQRAAVPDARRPGGAHPRTHRRLPLRIRLPVVRGAAGGRGQARERGCARDSRAAGIKKQEARSKKQEARSKKDSPMCAFSDSDNLQFRYLLLAS